MFQIGMLILEEVAVKRQKIGAEQLNVTLFVGKFQNAILWCQILKCAFFWCQTSKCDYCYPIQAYRGGYYILQ